MSLDDPSSSPHHSVGRDASGTGDVPPPAGGGDAPAAPRRPEYYSEYERILYHKPRTFRLDNNAYEILSIDVCHKVVHIIQFFRGFPEIPRIKLTLSYEEVIAAQQAPGSEISPYTI